MTLTNTGTWFSLLMLQNCSLRIVSSLKLSGVPLEFSRAEDGFITPFIALNHISCFSGGL